MNGNAALLFPGEVELQESAFIGSLGWGSLLLLGMGVSSSFLLGLH